MQIMMERTYKNKVKLPQWRFSLSLSNKGLNRQGSRKSVFRKMYIAKTFPYPVESNESDI